MEPDTPVTHADKLQAVKVNTKGEHPIMIEWLDAAGFHREVVSVLKVGPKFATVARELDELPWDALLRVNGALTTWGEQYYAKVDELKALRGTHIQARYAKKSTGEIKEYRDLIVLGVDDRYVAVRTSSHQYRRLLIANLELLKP